MEVEIGRVTHYFGKIGVAIIELTAAGLKIGDSIRIFGHTTDFIQTIESMQIEHQSITEANPGQTIGLKTTGPVREHDIVYKVTP